MNYLKLGHSENYSVKSRLKGDNINFATRNGCSYHLQIMATSPQNRKQDLLLPPGPLQGFLAGFAGNAHGGYRPGDEPFFGDLAAAELA